ncbi:LexA family transcriptional regulator [Massilia sp. CF038]|uniref:LexA family protein n=1 Tax=Massilia sp. CF038 TaxID=1881045 RepID=UPI000933746F|nr:S24 family peptidase [Massilia sp. CF038]
MRFWLMAHKIATGFGTAVPDQQAAISQDNTGAFLFAVTDHSMEDAGIVQGDKVVVDRSVAPEHGRLVIALVQGEYTLKRLFYFNGALELRAENAAQAPWRMPVDAQVQLWGVVVGVIRNYAN